MGKRYDSILGTIGHTPVIRINKLGPRGVNLYVKVESFNPMGSVKDRMALGVIEDAERRGELKPGQTIVEATSGNTGIGLAMVCAQKGYPLVVTMAENFSVERRRLMRFLGARVVLTPGNEMASGMLAKAEELARAHGWWQPRQFENPANVEIHARTTAVVFTVGGLFGAKTIKVVRPTGFGIDATQAFAAEGLHSDHGANHVAVDVNVADLRGRGERLRARIDAGLNAQRQAVAKRVDLLDDGFRGFERAAAPAHDLQHGTESFVFDLGQPAHFE